MDTLKEGARSADVAALQKRLQERGFPPGEIDGSYGPGTEAAVSAFQKSEGLVVDGVVGPQTAKALGFAEPDLPPVAAMPDFSVAMVSKMFPSTPLGPIKTHMPAVMRALKDANLTTAPIVLAALATIRAETEGFVPINEGRSRFNTSPNGHPFDLYDNRRDLGNRGRPDGERFCGRGFIQLTGRTNYEKFGPVVGVPNLVDRPEHANDPTIAAKLLAAFIASKATAIKTALAENDLRAARRLVNGGSHGLDRFTEAYQIGLRLLPKVG